MSAPSVAPGDSRLPWTQRRTASVLAWAVWAAMTAASLWYASSYAFSLPFADEMASLPQVCRRQPVTWAWLWAPHNEHRIFLPRLIYLGLGLATDYDFRAGSFWNVSMLAALAAVLMLTARAVRGRSSLYDAFLPLAVQNWGQPSGILWSFQMPFPTGSFLAGLALAAIARCRGSLSPAAALGITLSLVGAALCGAHGLLFLPPLGCWLILAGVLGRVPGNAGRLRHVVTLTALAAVLFALVIAYFAGFVRPPHPPLPGPWAFFVTAAEFLATSLGIGAATNAWPVSAILVLMGCAGSFAQLVRVIVRRPEERVRAFGLLAFLGAILLLALAVAWGRACCGPGAGMQDRYVTLSMPLLCLFYLQGVIYSRPVVWRHVQRALLLLMCVLLVVNCRKGLHYGQSSRGVFARLESDMRAGIPPEALAVRHRDGLGCAPIPVYAAQLEMLRQARRGPYRDDAVYRIDSTVRVQRLVELTQPIQSSPPWPFVPGREFQQPFSLPAGLALTRIDVEVGRVGHRRLCKRLDWTLYRRDPNGQRTIVTRGHVDPAQIDVGDYVSIALDRIAFSPGADLALGLSMPADTPEGQSARLFLFDGPTPGRPVDGGPAEGGPADRVVGSLHAFAFGIQLPAHQ